MRRYFETTLLIVIIAALPSVSVAQPAMWTEQLTRGDVGPSLAKLIGDYEVAINGPCAKADISFDLKEGAFESDPYSIKALKELGADFALQATAILYKCENREYQLLQFIYNAEEKFKFLILAPGKSNASYTLQKDVLEKIRATELNFVQSEGCPSLTSEEILVRNQRVNTFEMSERSFIKWTETWEMVSCGGFVEFEIEFSKLPNNNTGFRAKRRGA